MTIWRVLAVTGVLFAQQRDPEMAEWMERMRKEHQLPLHDWRPISNRITPVTEVKLSIHGGGEVASADGRRQHTHSRARHRRLR
jgi:hypothetical protein